MYPFYEPFAFDPAVRIGGDLFRFLESRDEYQTWFGKSCEILVTNDETREIAKEIVRCGGLDGRVDIALDYFDASINRISAWVTGYRNVQKALLSALLTPAECLKKLQDEGRFTELMVRQEELKTLPFGDIWDEYCRRCGKPADGEWFPQIEEYEKKVLVNRK